MKKRFLQLGFIVCLSCVLLLTILYAMRQRAVLFSISSDPFTLRPHNYCLLNPFRDRKPEHLAESYLSQLKNGKVAILDDYIGDRKYVMEEELAWPIQDWRVGEWEEKSGAIEIMYWVTRGNGYKGEEEVRFFIEHSPEGLKLKSYAAIY